MAQSRRPLQTNSTLIGDPSFKEFPSFTRSKPGNTRVSDSQNARRIPFIFINASNDDFEIRELALQQGAR